MKAFKISKHVEVVCESQNTRSGFRHVATLLINGIERDKAKCTYLNRTWERYTFESVLRKLADSTKELSDKDKKKFQKYIKDYNEESPFGTIAAVAKMGEVFGQNKKEKNDWKKRMLKAGLEKQGLEFPDDWDELNEDTKQARLDGAIKQIDS